MKIGFIGMGIMGLPMARNLKRSGEDITIYNRTFEKISMLDHEFKLAKSLDDLLTCDTIFSIVGYPSEVHEVYTYLIPKLEKPTRLIDMTTSSPKLAKELAILAKTYHHTLLDAPVTGGDIGAINGTLSMMVGGDYNTYLSVKPLLEKMTKAITYMGEAGNGQTMKLANQIAIAGNILGIAEAITFGMDHNLDISALLNVISNGSAASWQGTNNGPKMASHDYKPGFFIKHFLKDLRLAIDEKVTPLPLLTLAESAYASLSAYQDKGTQAIIEYYLEKNT